MYEISSTPHCAMFTKIVGELSDLKGDRRVGVGCLACCDGAGEFILSGSGYYC